MHPDDISTLAPSEVSEVDLYQKREKIYTRKIEGFFQRIRLFTGWPLLVGYFGLPWIHWDGRQAFLFDLPERKFHMLGLTIWPQDLPMLAWLLIIAAFSLFLVTTLFGRVWCGYTCPQTVWTSIFMWIEQKAEGSRNQRIKLDQEPWGINKLIRKIIKHGMWFGFAFLTGFTFIGYFTDIDELGYAFFTASVSMEALMWIIFFTLATYINAGWLREQVCLYMCPYARFQSAMFDRDTLIVSYNKNRGEPRGSRRKDSEHKQQGLGDCIDCQLCVQVCPTGIDIRNGLQYQCINCALCVDACDSVMQKMGYDPGLILYTTENAMDGKPSHMFLRPRVIGYGLAVAIMVTFFITHLALRIPLKLEIIRDRGNLYTLAADNRIENSYTLKLINMDNTDHQYRIAATGIDTIQFIGPDTVNVKSGEVLAHPVRISIKREAVRRPSTPIKFEIIATDDSKKHAAQENRFLAPP